MSTTCTAIAAVQSCLLLLDLHLLDVLLLIVFVLFAAADAGELQST